VVDLFFWNNAQYGIISRVTLMSRFLDLLQRLNKEGDQTSAASAGAIAQNTPAVSQLDQTLSILLTQEIHDPGKTENGSGPGQAISKLLPENSRHSEDLENKSEFSQIPAEKIHIDPTSRIIFYTDPGSPGANRFRFLRMRLRELWNTKKLRTLLITSPLPEDGKSTIALNLATALAEGGKRSVLLIEADLHHSPLTKQLSLRTGPGLGECLEDGLNPLSAVRRLEPLGWYLLSAGQPHGNPTDLLQAEALSVVIQRLSPHFDWILIDSPPVIPLTDALSLARQANGSLLVARAGRTPSEALEKAITLLGRQQVVGVVLNGVEQLDRLYSGYYGYSGNNNGTVHGKAEPAGSDHTAKY
jgi:capsular exopolysaccharide synthesis family protein